MPKAATLKADARSGREIEIKLTWKKLGFFKRLVSGDVDLDLGCYYQMADGKSMLIDALQFGQEPSRQGCLEQPPYIRHTGNDHGANVVSSESLLVNAAHLDSLRRLVVYCFVSGGKARWSDVDVELSISVPGAEPWAMTLGQHDTDKRFCTLAEIDIEPGGALAVKESVAFYDGHADCDGSSGWGFRYRDK